MNPFPPAARPFQALNCVPSSFDSSPSNVVRAFGEASSCFINRVLETQAKNLIEIVGHLQDELQTETSFQEIIHSKTFHHTRY